jgi:hypothetical protein
MEEQQKEIDDYARQLQGEGHEVHNPKYAVDQDDATGFNICLGHLHSMMMANRIDVFWDVNSKGSHFDLGMAFALNKPIKLVKIYQPDNEGKSYVKVIQEIQKQTDRVQELLYSLPEKIIDCQEEKLKCIKEQDFKKAAEYRQQEKELLTQLDIAKKYFKIT